MKRTELLQEVRKMRFEEAYGGWKRGRLTQEEVAAVARLLGVLDRKLTGNYHSFITVDGNGVTPICVSN
jgi:hypothetical protein